MVAPRFRPAVRAVIAIAIAISARTAFALDATRAFGVIIQRSPVLTATYWNPILKHVTDRTGVPLRLLVARTGPEHTAAVARGDADFLFSNHHLLPGHGSAGYRIVARSAQGASAGAIVVPAESAAAVLEDLAGRDVVFPSASAIFGYHLPMDALLRRGIRVHGRFAGNQEGAIGQLKAGRAVAAGVNVDAIEAFAARQGLEWRALWTSPTFASVPLAVHPRVPAVEVTAVRDALIAMPSDPTGRYVLEQAGEAVGQPPPHGFVAATDADYMDIRAFLRSSVVREP